MDWHLIGAALGGIGLLLLGMSTMTDGLRLAAGDSLRNLLEHATRSRLRGVTTGALITGIVQSSSAVTVATIGFVNAGLMTFRQSVPVIYGSNIGTTATAWLVALVGFHINIKLFALPMIGIGMLLRVFAGERRLGATGLALVGFGVFFTGIDLLRVTFDDLGTQLPIAELVREGPGGIIAALLIGFMLTMLMQSSSAALTIILTVTAGALVSLPSGAVMVIGANIGTTTTALIAVIGATPNAKRAASAHLIFNIGTGLVALLLLPVLLGLLALAASKTQGGGAPAAAVLALFHTAFNILGVLLFLPLTDRLVKFLARRFRSAEEDFVRPRYLDRTLLSTPALALGALARELERIAEFSRLMALQAIRGNLDQKTGITNQATTAKLLDTVSDYCQLLQRSSMTPDTAISLGQALLSVRDIQETVTEALQVAGCDMSGTHLPPGLRSSFGQYTNELEASLMAPPESTALASAQLEQRYQALKTELLDPANRIDPRSLIRLLDGLSAGRTATQKCMRARQRIRSLLQAGTTPIPVNGAISG